MTVENIIKEVRWCIDEEAVNSSALNASAYDYEDGARTDVGLMDNIIRHKIGDALRWICLYGPAELLGGSDEKQTVGGVEVDYPTGILVDEDGVTPSSIFNTIGGYINLPSDFIKLVRVKGITWHKAITKPIEEDSDEYLQLYDEHGAAATVDRPQAVIINRNKKQLEVWPLAQLTYTYVAEVDTTPHERIVEEGGETKTIEFYPIPPKAKTAFIYYLAFLLLSAYEDSRASKMLEIAKMNIGRNA